MKKLITLAVFAAGLFEGMVAAQSFKTTSSLFAPYSWTATAGDIVSVNGVVKFTVPSLPAGTSSMNASLRLSVLAK